MHLTNDGIQCKNEDKYGKHEEGNKLSYLTFSDYLTKRNTKHANVFANKILPRCAELVRESVCATQQELNRSKRSHCFELLGYDFMVDDQFKTYLIEINSNPCLEDWSCSLLRDMLPVLIDQVIAKATGTKSATASAHRLAKNDAEKDQLAQAVRRHL